MSQMPDLMGQIPNPFAKISIDECLETLTIQEENVIRLRFGIGSSAPLSLREIGMTLNLSAARIWSIKNKGLRKLRHKYRKERLLEIINA
jgi:RNA polymerase primary sigma factor